MNENKVLAVLVVLAFLAACKSVPAPSLTGSDVWHEHTTRPFMKFRHD